MKLTKQTPKKTYINSDSVEEITSLAKSLKYSNKSVGYQLNNVKRNNWWRKKDPTGWKEEVSRLESLKDGSLLNKDGHKYWMFTGYLPYLPKKYKADIVDNIKYPEFKKLAWKRKFPYDYYDDQKNAIKKLLEIKHGNVQMCTGSGKTAIILELAATIGNRVVVVTPGKDLFNDLREKFRHYFGDDQVGWYGDGKKKIGKTITVCVAKSLTMIERGTVEWDFFSNATAIIGDESHTLPAKTMEKTFHDLLSEVPYRLFVSGTQTRGDGTEKLLRAIIGETVYTLSTKNAIKKNICCNLDFNIVDVLTEKPKYHVRDPNKMKREHLLRNKNIAQWIAKLANVVWEKRQQQTLILVEEIDQISMISKLLKVPYTYCHGNTIKKDKLTKMGLERTKNKDNIELFNTGKKKVLIGTSCISTGTNIFPAHHVVNWQGGASEISTKQGAIGRAVRIIEKSPYKDLFEPIPIKRVWDFNVVGIELLQKSLDKRIFWYEETGCEVRRISLGK